MKLFTTTSALAGSALVAGVLLALSAPLAARAHVSAGATSTAAGSSTLLTFATAHGCDGSPTTIIAISLPEGVASVAPTVNAGWGVEKVAADLATPIDDGHGNTVATRTGQVVYTAQAPLASGLRTTFVLSFTIPADAEGETLEFPVLQTCETGSTNWSETTVDGEEEPAHPAPFIAVTEAAGDGHEHGAATTDHAETTEAATESAASSDDVLARVLGVGGLAVGAVGIVLAVSARRKQSA
ncbi:YcnI family protein [Cryobacterium psychrophilum]|uniref:DUF1775 domain-containing protein n=1 Tax=Cryobacterium psychrophilum TaxID=41988 RepID=A0A4Y8KKU9_9MICO|nr:YcnI family protein [Cryobacterium psychrophilum]TDW29973.1 uncharacterized protein YcnI [Cryobacterium psychrophilum]TFD76530.1 DUF1775 domain-containing protein [Cryobacterium psychrophilum]